MPAARALSASAWCTGAGNPAAMISDIRKVETVFRQGIGYDPVKLIASVTGKAGLW